MANRRKAKSRPGLPQVARRYGNPTKEYSPDATSVPGPLVDTKYSTRTISPDRTKVPLLEPESVGSEYTMRSKWNILDKYILRKFSLPILLTMIICGALFIQDNGAGKLEDWKAILWTLKKCGVVTALFLSLVFIQWLVQKITKR